MTMPLRRTLLRLQRGVIHTIWRAVRSLLFQSGRPLNQTIPVAYLGVALWLLSCPHTHAQVGVASWTSPVAIANGAELRFRHLDLLCGDRLLVADPFANAVTRRELSQGAESFTHIASQQMRAALDVGHLVAIHDDEALVLHVRTHLRLFRPSHRWSNILALAGGGLMNDPGEYDIEVEVRDPRKQQVLVWARFASAPTIAVLLFGNSLSRQGAMRSSLRKQTKALARFWQTLHRGCPEPEVSVGKASDHHD